MNIATGDITKYAGVAVILFSVATSYAVNDQQIKVNKGDIKDLQKDREQQVRMEERQLMIKEDLDEIKQLLKEVVK